MSHEKPEKINILDIPFYKVTKAEALNFVLGKLQSSSRQLFIATPNPEILLEAQKNQQFREVLQKTDLNIADGSGILLAAKWQGTPLPERVTGVDFMLSICKEARSGTKIFLLGATEGVAEKVKTVLEKQFPHIQIVGTFSGSPSPNIEQKICTKIKKTEAQILFIAFGAPKQELWIARNLPQLKNIRLAMGIGGAFDFIAGMKKRAPLWMQKLWLEWLYRLIQEPGRIKRIFNATMKFPFVFLWKKFRN